MAWFLNIIKPQINNTTSKESEVPANLWKLCPGCNEMIYFKEWEQNLCVCKICNFHERISCLKRLNYTATEIIALINIEQKCHDPLNFKDKISYKTRLKEACEKTNLTDAAISAHIKINESEAVAFIMDFNFIGGSMGSYVGNLFYESANYAIEKKLPLIAFTASGGARMQEGIISLMQMPKTVMAVKKLEENNIPYIVILTDPTTGGVIASFAMLADFTIAEPNALIGFTGARVIEETMNIKLPANFQRSEFQLNHGFVDEIIQRFDLQNRLSALLKLI